MLVVHTVNGLSIIKKILELTIFVKECFVFVRLCDLLILFVNKLQNDKNDDILFSQCFTLKTDNSDLEKLSS